MSVYERNTQELTLVRSGGARDADGADELGFAVGSEERFFFVWARNAAKLATRELALLLSMVGNLGLSLLMVYVVRFQA